MFFKLQKEKKTDIKTEFKYFKDTVVSIIKSNLSNFFNNII